MATFTFIPDFTAEVTVKPRVRVARFGDGYEQRTEDGINTMPETWALQFDNRTDTERAEIKSFLKERRGIEAFDWTTPEGMAGKFVCREWSGRLTAFNINSLSFVFEQVFEG